MKNFCQLFSYSRASPSLPVFLPVLLWRIYSRAGWTFTIIYNILFVTHSGMARGRKYKEKRHVLFHLQMFPQMLLIMDDSTPLLQGQPYATCEWCSSVEYTTAIQRSGAVEYRTAVEWLMECRRCSTVVRHTVPGTRYRTLLLAGRCSTKRAKSMQ